MLLNNGNTVPGRLVLSLLGILKHIEKIKVTCVTCIGHTANDTKIIRLNTNSTLSTSIFLGESITRVKCTIPKKQVIRNPIFTELHNLLHPGSPTKPLDLTIYYRVVQQQIKNYDNLFPNTSFVPNHSGNLGKPVKVVSPSSQLGDVLLCVPTGFVSDPEEIELLRLSDVTCEFHLLRSPSLNRSTGNNEEETEENITCCSSLLSCVSAMTSCCRQNHQ
ncbi:DUF3023 domain-containing protein [Ehrlichia ruminantium]|uniref:DUF3023 domain-containing protein n=1 Tax=Ehrlichia ruminantium TaxID=779 RepID=UPI0015DD3CBF|nr:DUF3023 domain-containing protein [Ehrlichia ruminantium]QLK50636.1 DUF3023 domain-containing protein [Ehrlichia ruminantium]QLK51561.1 DUF3023 domain-containing protein [Ehrlichia ruminantium]